MATDPIPPKQEGQSEIDDSLRRMFDNGFTQGVASERAESDRWRLKNIELDTENERLRSMLNELKAYLKIHDERVVLAFIEKLEMGGK